jgi:hypothetical protein
MVHKTRKTRGRRVRFSRRLIQGGSKPVVIQNPLVKVPPAAGVGFTTSPPRKPKKPNQHKKSGMKKLKA